MEILWQDQYIGIINKPSGLLMHTSDFSRDEDTLIKRLRTQFSIPPLPVHRLDRPVSGVIVGAFDKHTASKLSMAFRERRVGKTYVAFVRGFLTGEGEIHIPLKNANTGEMQPSRTLYKGIKTIELPIPSKKYPTSRYSMVVLSPMTGRFHQLRRHVARIGHPIVGDTSHGDTSCNHSFYDSFGIEGLLLHSFSIDFTHPITEEKVQVVSPLREDLTEICRRFNWPVLTAEHSNYLGFSVQSQSDIWYRDDI